MKALPGPPSTPRPANSKVRAYGGGGLDLGVPLFVFPGMPLVVSLIMMLIMYGWPGVLIELAAIFGIIGWAAYFVTLPGRRWRRAVKLADKFWSQESARPSLDQLIDLDKPVLSEILRERRRLNAETGQVEDFELITIITEDGERIPIRYLP